MFDRTTRVASSIALYLFSRILLAALMQHSETTIPVPAPGEKTPLKKLEYRARFVASIDSVMLELEPGDADPVVARWSFFGSNSDGQAHRVEIVVRLLDEAGSQRAIYSTRSILPPGSRDQRIELTSKVKAETWKAVKRARIFADWVS